MSQPDFHQILGVTPCATAAEIKRAFKRMAMRWHPDRNADPQAHEQFRLAREAFEHLTGIRETEAPKASEASSPPRRPKGEDRRLHIDVDLAEAAFGGTITVSLEGRVNCTSCEGSGRRSYGRTTMCGTCHGSGRVRSSAGLKPCPSCSGKGYFTDNHCPDCEGRGWNAADRQLVVSIPAAMLPGEELRIAGQGGPAPENGESGDLYLTLHARVHPLFRLEGPDIHLDLPVSIFRVLAGGVIDVPSLNGVHEALLPEASTTTEIRLPGAGFPARGRRHAGDLIAHLQVQYPRYLSNEQRALLEMADQVLQQQLDDQSPTLARWRDTLNQNR
ncbi:MAG: DnaJ C-terminal domain-containing protein [Zoogloea sp.]|uniref:DnaJ C-terminal domain-containing protein n=1 Tax=Zoogloea sp. TaxID=49181 RepID=UPI0026266973|nr:DnaJ C-terminal domain-containing protein [Zoogloea sp.]MDD2990334.1 DnaJ C-terminal domain-containing protein [Zoogloea sp.]